MLIKDKEVDALINIMCKELLLSNDCKIKINEFINKDTSRDKIFCPTCKKLINRRVPDKRTVVATSIYLSSILCGEPRTQNEINLAIGINPVTLRKHIRIMQNILDRINGEQE